MTLRMSGSAPARTRSTSSAHAGTSRCAPPGGVHGTSATDMPWRGSKKHGGRRCGSGSPATRARTHAIA